MPRDRDVWGVGGGRDSREEGTVIEIKSTKQVVDDFGLKILVHGPPGVGKTRLCVTTGDLDNTLIISAEGGLLSIKDWDVDVAQVRNVNDVYEVYEFLKGGEHDYTWVCLDSISEIAEVILQGEKLRNRDGRRAYGEMADTVFDLLRGFRNLPYHVVMTAKQGREEIDGRVLHAPMLPGRQLTLNIAYLFDEVFALRVETNQEGELIRVLQTGKSRSFEAKDRSGKLGMYEQANLEGIHRKIAGLPELVVEEEEEEIVQTNKEGDVKRIAVPPASDRKRVTSSGEGEAKRIGGGAASELRRTNLRRKLFMLLKEAGVKNAMITQYITARCEREVGVDGVNDVPIEILELWAQELDIPSKPAEGAKFSPRRMHINATIKLWKEWKGNQPQPATA